MWTAYRIHPSESDDKTDKMVALARDIRDKLLGIADWD
jgi:hypothetical protein